MRHARRSTAAPRRHRVRFLLGAALLLALIAAQGSGIPGPIGWLCSAPASAALPMAVAALIVAGVLLAGGARLLPVGLALVAVFMLGQLAARSGRVLPPSGSAHDLRVLVLNASPTLNELGPLLATIEREAPDLVVLVEASATLAREARRGSQLPLAYPHHAVQSPESDVNGWVILLSRFPLHAVDRSSVGLVSAVVEQASGEEVGVIAFYASSPRTPARRAAGNAIASRVAAAAQAHERAGRRVLAMGDLNANRADHRERLIRRGGALRRAKPLLTPAGTFPAAIPALLAVPIDDAWLGRGVEPASWRVLEPVGSDHRPVLVDCRFDQ